MAPTVNQIREAIAAVLGTIPDTQVSAWLLGSPTLPCLQVVSGEIPYDETFGRGSDMYVFKVQAMVGLVTDIGAQKRLGQYANATGTYSVRAAIDADNTLGGVVQHAQVTSASEEQVYSLPERPPVIGREWTIEVLATGV